MPSYLVTIRLSAETQGRATVLAEAIASGECEAVRLGLVRTRLESVTEDTPAPCPTKKYDLGQQWSCLLGVDHDGACRFDRLADAPPAETTSAVRALSPAVVEELRQMWRADARDEAKLVVREFVPGTYRSRIP